MYCTLAGLKSHDGHSTRFLLLLLQLELDQAHIRPGCKACIRWEVRTVDRALPCPFLRPDLYRNS